MADQQGAQGGQEAALRVPVYVRIANTNLRAPLLDELELGPQRGAAAVAAAVGELRQWQEVRDRRGFDPDFFEIEVLGPHAEEFVPLGPRNTVAAGTQAICIVAHQNQVAPQVQPQGSNRHELRAQPERTNIANFELPGALDAQVPRFFTIPGIRHTPPRLLLRQAMLDLWHRLDGVQLFDQVVGSPGHGTSLATRAWAVDRARQGQHIVVVQVGAMELLTLHAGVMERRIERDIAQALENTQFAGVGVLVIDGYRAAYQNSGACLQVAIVLVQRNPDLRVVLVSSGAAERLHANDRTLLDRGDGGCVPHTFGSWTEAEIRQMNAELGDQGFDPETLQNLRYYCGTNARLTFQYGQDIDVVRRVLDQAIQQLHQPGLDRGHPNAVNLLINDDGSLISEYALRCLATGRGLEQAVAILETSLTPGARGVLYELRFISRVKRLAAGTVAGRPPPTMQVGNVVLTVGPFHAFWDHTRDNNQPFPLPEVLLPHCWLFPLKVNQGCFDALQLVPAANTRRGWPHATNNPILLRVYQVTTAARHALGLHHLVPFVRALTASFANNQPRFLIRRIDYCFVAPAEVDPTEQARFSDNTPVDVRTLIFPQN